VTGAVSGESDDLISFEFVRVDCAIGIHKLHERQVEEDNDVLRFVSQPMRGTIEQESPPWRVESLDWSKRSKHGLGMLGNEDDAESERKVLLALAEKLFDLPFVERRTVASCTTWKSNRMSGGAYLTGQGWKGRFKEPVEKGKARCIRKRKKKEQET